MPHCQNLYYGNSGDSMYSHNGLPFSTFDVDNDNRSTIISFLDTILDNEAFFWAGSRLVSWLDCPKNKYLDIPRKRTGTVI